MTTPVVRRIDHLIIRADGAAHERVLATFRDLLGLPTPWPASEHPAFTSAGIFAGNVDFELLALKGGKPPNRPPGAGLYGIVFEMHSSFEEISRDLHGLRSRRIPYLPMPYTVRREGGGRETYWHNVFLAKLIGRNRWMDGIFLCKRLHPDRLWMRMMARGNSTNPSAARFMFDTVYRDGIVFAVKYDPAWRDIDRERRQSEEAFGKVDGGSLGLRRVRSVRVGVSDFSRAKRLWERLLHPHEKVGAAEWRIGDGPGVELTPSDCDGIVSMTWEVARLDAAKGFLEGRRIGYDEVDQGLRISRDALFGLDIRLVQAPPLSRDEEEHMHVAGSQGT